VLRDFSLFQLHMLYRGGSSWIQYTIRPESPAHYPVPNFIRPIRLPIPILLSCSDNRLPKILLKKEVRRRPGETPRSLGRRRCTLLGVLQVQLSDPPSSKALGLNFFDHMS